MYHQIRNFGNHLPSVAASRTRLNCCESLKKSKATEFHGWGCETAAGARWELSRTHAQWGPESKLTFLCILKLFERSCSTERGSHCLVSSSDNSVDLLCWKRLKSPFTKQLIFTHISSCCDIDVGDRFTRGRWGSEMLVYLVKAFASSVIAVYRFAMLRITSRLCWTFSVVSQW